MERLLREKLPKGRFIRVKPSHRRIMQSIKGRGNRTTEARLRAALVGTGVRGWVLNAPAIKGRPDFFFPRAAVAVFVDGCFWHGCPRCGHVPRKNAPFWQAKILRNRQRDRQTSGALRRQGIQVVRFWEHDVVTATHACVQKLLTILRERDS